MCDCRRQRSNEIGPSHCESHARLLAWCTNKRTHARNRFWVKSLNWRLTIYSVFILHRSEWCLLNVWNCRHTTQGKHPTLIIHRATHKQLWSLSLLLHCMQWMLLACAAAAVAAYAFYPSDNMCSCFISLRLCCFALITWWRASLCSRRNVFIYVYLWYKRRWNIKMSKNNMMMMKAQSSATFNRSLARSPHFNVLT